jgi:hypothetical protein
MMDTVKKRHKSFKWTEEAKRSFNILKEKITKQPILGFLDFGKTFQEFQVRTLGFEHLKEMYHDDLDFKEAYEACANTVVRYRNQWAEYVIQDGLLFKGCQLCIPKCLMRENLLKENHSGGLPEHFGHQKTFA